MAFSLYDEIAIGLRAVTGLGFRELLAAQQIVNARESESGACLLLGEALGLTFAGAAMATAICSLGATIAGPAVLAIEYEPTPPGVSPSPLLLCAMGLAARGPVPPASPASQRLWRSSIIRPTALPFWGIWLLVARAGRRSSPFSVASVILFAASRLQSETQTFLARLFARASKLCSACAPSYVYISTWPWGDDRAPPGRIRGAARRVPGACAQKNGHRGRERFCSDSPIIGLLSMPISWLLLEHWKWGLVPQVQPMRNLLFVTLRDAVPRGGRGPARPGNKIEGGGHGSAGAFPAGDARRASGQVGVARDGRSGPWPPVAGKWRIAGGGLLRSSSCRWATPDLHTPELEQLSEWARQLHSKGTPSFPLRRRRPASSTPESFRTAAPASRLRRLERRGPGQLPERLRRAMVVPLAAGRGAADRFTRAMKRWESNSWSSGTSIAFRGRQSMKNSALRGLFAANTNLPARAGVAYILTAFSQ